ncbi:MAG TPA: hypothetical protein VHE81_04615 [Lacipirellulaceae bacterium]|nr:hypothetical protein [Lacipirellulaceae bacterium]
MAIPRRKKQFIDSNVQGALARRVILHWLVFTLITAVVTFILQVLADPFRPLSAHLHDMWLVQGPLLLVMVFLLPVFVMDTIKLSNRFAGPIFSLRRAIREVAQGGAPKKLKFRRHDFWRDLADDYNNMLSRLGALDDEADTARDDQTVTISSKQ